MYNNHIFIHAKITYHPTISGLLDLKISGMHSCTQEMIGGGKFMLTMINLVPLRCLMPTGMENSSECSNGRATEEVSDTICAPCFIIDVEMELL
jgi:hypothetical protein